MKNLMTMILLREITTLKRRTIILKNEISSIKSSIKRYSSITDLQKEETISELKLSNINERILRITFSRDCEKNR
jgi:hypothetical protein